MYLLINHVRNSFISLCFSYNNFYYIANSLLHISIEPSCRYQFKESVYNRCAQKGCHLYSRLEIHMSITEHPTYMKNERERDFKHALVYETIKKKTKKKVGRK